MDEQVKNQEAAVSLIDRIHNLSLWTLTLCGFVALISLAINILTALMMFVSQRKK